MASRFTQPPAARTVSVWRPGPRRRRGAFQRQNSSVSLTRKTPLSGRCQMSRRQLYSDPPSQDTVRLPRSPAVRGRSAASCGSQIALTSTSRLSSTRTSSSSLAAKVFLAAAIVVSAALWRRAASAAFGAGESAPLARSSAAGIGSTARRGVRAKWMRSSASSGHQPLSAVGASFARRGVMPSATVFTHLPVFVSTTATDLASGKLTNSLSIGIGGTM